MSVIYSGKSDLTDPKAAVEQATSKFGDVYFLIYISSPQVFLTVTECIKEKFPNIKTIGTTAGSLYINGGEYENSLTIIGFPNDVECETGVIEEITRFPIKYTPRIAESLMRIENKENTICLEFITAGSFSEELVLYALNSICNIYSIPVVGGTASFYLKQDNNENKDKKTDTVQKLLESTLVAENGIAYHNACVYVFIHNKKGKINIYNENIYVSTEKEFSVTSVDVSKRIIYELNNKPAGSVFFKTIGLTEAEYASSIRKYQLGRKSSNGYNLINIKKIESDGAIYCNARVFNQIKLTLLEPANYREITKETFSRIKKENGPDSLLFIIHCASRVNYYKDEKFFDEYNQSLCGLFKNTFGFVSLGEQLDDVHMNNTILFIVFEDLCKD